MLRHIGCHSYLPLSGPWWLIYTPMTQFIAYGSCVLRDFNAVSLIFENFTHVRIDPGVAHVSKHQENYAKPTLIRLKTPATILDFRFLPLDTSIYYTCLHTVNILLVQFGPRFNDDLPPTQFWNWSLRLILTWNFIILILSWWRYRFVIALI